MSTTSQNPVPIDVAEICKLPGFGDKAKKLASQGVEPEQLIQSLVDAGEPADAVRFLAHALPRRESVWWAWVCARRAAGASPPPDVMDCLSATEKWIAQPTDENRRLAFQMAAAVDFGTPAGSAGLAAFFCGSSLAPPGVDPVPPGPHLRSNAVVGAIMLSAISTEPEKAEQNYRTYIAQGLEVARKIKLWPPAGTDAPG